MARFSVGVSSSVLILGLLAACSSLNPHRTQYSGEWLKEPFSRNRVDDVRVRCEPNDDGAVDRACAAEIVEHSSHYDLYFAEFDDEGELYPPTPANGHAGSDIQIILESLARTGPPFFAQGPDDPSRRLSVVVFVHGWRHSADYEDDNVEVFRRTLAQLDAIEHTDHQGCGRKIVGIYVGWRGAGTIDPDAKTELTTFYARKSAAERVAQGDVRALFAGLKRYQDFANARWISKRFAEEQALVNQPRQLQAEAAHKAPAEAKLDCDKPVRLTTIGHSFGGLIVYTSLEQGLIADVTNLQQLDRIAMAQVGTPALPREGDLVFLVNSASEATRFEPLLRAAAENPTFRYHSPLLVSVTSADDSATKLAFHLARRVGQVLERYPEGNDIEKLANVETIGHFTPFQTHTLSTIDASRENDEAYLSLKDPLGNPRPCKRAADGVGPPPAIVQLNAYYQAMSANGFDAAGIPRLFCVSGPDVGVKGSPEINEVLVLQGITHFGASVGSPKTPPANAGVPLIPALGLPPAFAARPCTSSPADWLEAISSLCQPNIPVWNVYTGAPIVRDHNDFANPRLLAFFLALYREAGMAAYDQFSPMSLGGAF